VNGSNPLQGDVTFNVSHDSQTYIVPKLSYISAQIQIVMTREDGSQHPLERIINTGTRANRTCGSVPYLAPNVGHCLWENSTTNLKSSTIINYQNTGSNHTLYRMLYESKSEQLTVNSTNPINILSPQDVDVTPFTFYKNAVKLATNLGVQGGAINTFTQLLSPHMVWALEKSQYNFDKCMTNRVNFQVPSELFLIDELLHVGSGNLQIVLNPRPTYWQDIICVAGSNACAIPAIEGPPAVAAGVNYTVTNKNAGFAPCTINVSVNDLRLYICRAHVTSNYIPRSIKNTLFLKKFASFRQPLTAGNSQTITVPFPENRHITHIICAFLTNLGEQSKSAPTDFCKGFSIAANAETLNTTDAMSLLTTINVTIGGITYPQSAYNTNDTSGSTAAFVSGATPSTVNDLQKCYTDTCAFVDSMRDRAGWISFGEWQNSQVYVFKMRQAMNDNNNTAYITLNTSTNIAIPTSLHILALYDEYIELEYDNYAQLIGLKRMSNISEVEEQV